MFGGHGAQHVPGRRAPLVPVLGLALALAGGGGIAQAAAVTDTEIGHEVAEEMLFDQSLDLNRIDIDVDAGIVELDGTVDGLASKYRAETLASTVKGVVAVDNDLIVTPPMTRTDRQIRSDVHDALLNDPATDSYEVDVSVDEGVVTLTGEVESWHEKDLSERVASGVKGVRAVMNRLDIRYDAARLDSEMEAEIEQKLKYDALVDHEPLDVEVKDGEATLTGTATTLAEKNRAVFDAWTNGITDVDASDVDVLWDVDTFTVRFVPPSDAAIEDAVLDAAAFDPRVSSFEIEATSEDGVVTLRGKVDNLKARRAAVELARNTAGVVRVKDRIKVRPTVMPTNESLEQDIQSAMLRDPIVESFEVEADAHQGRVTLTGTVDTFAEKAQAEDVAAGIYGVVNLRNEIEVSGDDVAFTYEPYAYPYYPYVRTWTYYVPDESALQDREIRDDVEDELWWSPWVDADDVDVTVDDGTAILQGKVGSFEEYRAAEENALEGGALNVKNRLVIDTSSTD